MLPCAGCRLRRKSDAVDSWAIKFFHLRFGVFPRIGYARAHSLPAPQLFDHSNFDHERDAARVPKITVNVEHRRQRGQSMFSRTFPHHRLSVVKRDTVTRRLKARGASHAARFYSQRCPRERSRHVGIGPSIFGHIGIRTVHSFPKLIVLTRRR